jgi:GR25 family glycosyltransferase involved in LPS biosynthesis
MINGYIIAIRDTQSVAPLVTSIEKTKSEIRPIVFEATTPDTIDNHLEKEFNYFDSSKFNWTWPTDASQNKFDIKTGVYKFAYNAVNQDKKIACSISHMRLWDLCVTSDKPIVIFEADALLTRQFDVSELGDAKFVGLNDPRGATRRSQKFHQIVSSKNGIQIVPTINDSGEFHPQGVAGHSAYYITPAGAKELLDKVKEYGMWPNDAYVCKELFPWIRVVYPYFTRVQGTASTTTR